MIQVRQSKAAAAARAQAQVEAADRLLRLGLTPDDTLRFRRHLDRGSKIEARPMDVADDGSVKCSAGGKVRSIRPEIIEVRRRGPRGGTRWEPLTDQEDLTK